MDRLEESIQQILYSVLPLLFSATQLAGGCLRKSLIVIYEKCGIVHIPAYIFIEFNQLSKLISIIFILINRKLRYIFSHFNLKFDLRSKIFYFHLEIECSQYASKLALGLQYLSGITN